MQVISVNVGLPRAVNWKGKTVITGIFKEPVLGKITMRSLNLNGDKQADLTVHGGRDKAVYAYPSEHYEYWHHQLGDVPLPWGAFGENLSIVGLHENAVYIGDRFRVGTAEVVVTQPRTPCYKLGIKFGDAAMVKRFADSDRPGFYLAVLQEGEVEAGSSIELVGREENSIAVNDINQLERRGTDDLALLQKIVQIESLSTSWREHFQAKIARLIS